MTNKVKDIFEKWGQFMWADPYLDQRVDATDKAAQSLLDHLLAQPELERWPTNTTFGEVDQAYTNGLNTAKYDVIAMLRRELGSKEEK